jgi:ABC-type Fe3+ transport system substrate-binding protein
MPDVIRIEGLDRLRRQIKRIEDLDGVANAMKAAAVHVKGKIAEYPPASEANDPAQRKWYERGYGPKWRVISGAIHGKKSSETLGRKWTTKAKDKGLTQVIGNNVSYGPFVQGDKQAAFHKKRGWKTTEQIAEEEKDEVLKFVQAEIEKVLESRI